MVVTHRRLKVLAVMAVAAVGLVVYGILVPFHYPAARFLVFQPDSPGYQSVAPWSSVRPSAKRLIRYGGSLPVGTKGLVVAYEYVGPATWRHPIDDQKNRADMYMVHVYEENGSSYTTTVMYDGGTQTVLDRSDVAVVMCDRELTDEDAKEMRDTLFTGRDELRASAGRR